MQCIYCGHEKTKVTQTIAISLSVDGETKPAVSRRRQCLNSKCEKKFRTTETVMKRADGW
jgi:transcriptional regulator NrdR family protein